jgi:cytochrome c biogenesis protein CcmG/thiol:disulfide interchange protein DsbE
MKNALAVAVLLGGIAALGVAQAKAPNFSLKTAEGQVVELAKFQGKAVVVNFWATWCGPCRSEIPGMLEVYGKYREKGVEIIGVSLDQGGFKDVTPFVKRFNITYPVVVGNEAVVDAYGGVNSIPTTFFVDRKGNVVKKHVGYMSKEEFEKNIRLAL